jgi:predicted DNA binding CopG/RHH family protein
VSKKKPIPRFQSEDEEQAFWDEHDSTGHVDWSEARPVVLANLQASTKTLSLRLPEHMLEELKLLANKRDVPYQPLLKVFLAERIQSDLKRMRGSASPRRQGPDLGSGRRRPRAVYGSGLPYDVQDTAVLQLSCLPGAPHPRRQAA